MNKHTFLSGVALVLVALAFLLTDWLLTPPPGVTEANVKRLRPGMTVEQIEAILGQRLDIPIRFSALSGSGFGGNVEVRRVAIDPRIAVPAGVEKIARSVQGDDTVDGVHRDASWGAASDKWAVYYWFQFPLTVPGQGGSAWLYLDRHDRLDSAEWQPNPAASRASPGSSLRGWLGW